MPDSPAQIDTTAARAYDDHMVPIMFGPWVEDVVALAQLRPAERVLDVACGTGTATHAAATRVTPQGFVAGLDIDPAMIETNLDGQRRRRSASSCFASIVLARR